MRSKRGGRYATLVTSCVQLIDNNHGTWTTSYGQTSSGNQGADGSPYFGTNGLGMFISAVNIGSVQSTLLATSVISICASKIVVTTTTPRKSKTTTTKTMEMTWKLTQILIQQ